MVNTRYPIIASSKFFNNNKDGQQDSIKLNIEMRSAGLFLKTITLDFCIADFITKLLRLWLINVVRHIINVINKIKIK